MREQTKEQRKLLKEKPIFTEACLITAEDFNSANNPAIDTEIRLGIMIEYLKKVFAQYIKNKRFFMKNGNIVKLLRFNDLDLNKLVFFQKYSPDLYPILLTKCKIMMQIDGRMYVSDSFLNNSEMFSGETLQILQNYALIRSNAAADKRQNPLLNQKQSERPILSKPTDASSTNHPARFFYNLGQDTVCPQRSSDPNQNFLESLNDPSFSAAFREFFNS